MLRLKVDGSKLARVRGSPNTQVEGRQAIPRHASATNSMDRSAAIDHTAASATPAVTDN